MLEESTKQMEELSQATIAAENTFHESMKIMKKEIAWICKSMDNLSFAFKLTGNKEVSGKLAKWSTDLENTLMDVYTDYQDFKIAKCNEEIGRPIHTLSTMLAMTSLKEKSDESMGESSNT